MTDRKHELQALLDKVEAGERGDGLNTASVFSAPSDMNAVDAFDGSTDAAVAFINAMLPGWWWSIGTCKVSDDARVSPEGEASVRNGKEWSEITDVDLRPPGNPARALLMSGLIALIELEGGAHE